MKNGSQLKLNNVYVGNVIHGVSKKKRDFFAKAYGGDPFLTQKDIESKFSRNKECEIEDDKPDMVDEFEKIKEGVNSDVFWTVSFGTRRLAKNWYLIPSTDKAGIPWRYNFSNEKRRESFFEKTNSYVFHAEKIEGEKRYAIVGTSDPGQFSDEVRKNAHLFDGVKFGAFRKLQLNTAEAQKSMQKLVEVCKENNWPMLIHTSIVDFKSNEGLEGIYELASKNPEVNFCVSHMGGDISKWKDKDYHYYLKERVKCIKKWECIPENMYFNTAVKDLKLVEALLNEVPQLEKNIVLASDVPFAFKKFEVFEKAVWDTFKKAEVEQFNENALRYGNNE